MKAGHKLAALAALVASAAVGVTMLDAEAQQPRGRPPITRPGAPKRDAGVTDTTSPEAGVAPRMSETAPVAAVDAGVIEVKQLDGGTQVFKFGEVELEGRLKTPNLVYFLRRVRTEFGANDLGHRSFMRELSETRKTQSF